MVSRDKNIGTLVYEWEESDLKAKRQERHAELARGRAHELREKIRTLLQTEVDRCLSLYQETHPESLRFEDVIIERTFDPEHKSVTLKIRKVLQSNGSSYPHFIGDCRYKHSDWKRFDQFLKEHLGWKSEFGFLTITTSAYYDSDAGK